MTQSELTFQWRSITRHKKRYGARFLEHRKIREIAEILGIAAIVASLVFVGLQLRQSDQIARAEIQATFGLMSIEIAALISEHSDVWVRGDAQEELSDADTVVFENLVLAVNDSMYSNFWQTWQIDGEQSALEYLHDFSGFLYRHPGVRQVWTEREANLQRYRIALGSNVEDTSLYVETILNGLDELDRIQP